MDWIGLDLTFPITDPTWIFLLVLLIILFAPILLNKLRIPHIIGMILAGLAIGEHGFNILVRDSSFQLFGLADASALCNASARSKSIAIKAQNPRLLDASAFPDL